MNKSDATQGQFDIPIWPTGRTHDGSVGSLDPFESILSHVQKGGYSEDERHVIIRVYDDLDVARSIALSIYGQRWYEHVAEIYDQIQVAMREPK